MVREGYFASGVGAALGSLLISGNLFAQSTATFPSDQPAAPASATPPAPPAEAPTPAAPPTESAPLAPLAPAPAPPVGATPVAPSPSEVPPPSEPPAPPLKPPEPVRYVSATISPIHLLFPIFEMDIEVMPIPHFGVALLGGIGQTTLRSTQPDVDGTKATVYELGAHLVGYPLKDFSSLQLGAEVLWVKVDMDDIDVEGAQISASGAGVAFGPFVGYKFIADIGFTLYVQGGFQYTKVAAEAHASTGESANAEQDGFGPLLNFNLGWSF
jgi:hypothetical protein